MAVIPSSTLFNSLLDALIAKMEAITDVQEVVVGTLGSHVIKTRDASTFPLIEIIIQDFTIVEYNAQRVMTGMYAFEMKGHTYTATKSRIDGDDMKTVNNLGAVIRTQFFSFNDDVEAGNLPCTGFLQVAGNFTQKPHYQYHSANHNMVICNGHVLVDANDTTS